MRRLISKTPDASLNQPSISFTYNDLGQRASMTDASGTTAYTYDTRNRLQSKQTPFGTLSYGYDAAGNIETLRSSHANGVSVDYAYDELNRLKTAKDNRLAGNRTTSYNVRDVPAGYVPLYTAEEPSTGASDSRRATVRIVSGGAVETFTINVMIRNGPDGPRYSFEVLSQTVEPEEIVPQVTRASPPAQ